MIIRKIIPESVSEVIHLKNLKNGLTSLVLPFFFFLIFCKLPANVQIMDCGLHYMKNNNLVLTKI